MLRPTCLRICIASFAIAPGVGAQSPEFTGLPSCTFSSCRTTASALSADGTTLVGNRGHNAFIEFQPVFWWTAARGFNDLPGTTDFATHRASSVSADGSIIVGTTSTFSPHLPGFPGARVYAWRWTSAGLVELGSLGGLLLEGGMWSEANGVSADGAIVVGGSLAPTGFEAFRWTQTSGMVGLGSLGGAAPLFRSAALGISANGDVIVGQSDSPAGLQAFRWTQASGMTGLGDLPGGTFQSSATAASANGTVIVGQGTSVNGPEAFRWTQSSGMVGLGALPGGSFRSLARAVSADGSIVVGDSDTAIGPEAFIWTQSSGMRRIADGLIAAGVSLAGWTLQNATGISADGSVIVGNGLGPTPRGTTEAQAWIARSAGGSLPPGLTTPASLLESIANMPSVTLAAERMGRADMRRMLSVARSTPRPRGEPVRVAASGTLPSMTIEDVAAREFYAIGSAQTWNEDPRTQGTAPGLTMGIAINARADWRFGAGLSAATSREDTVYGGRYSTDAVGIHAFASWRSGAAGLRGMALLNHLDVDASIRRGYLNGAGTTTSSGSTAGRSTGVLGRLEYAFALPPHIELVPYLDYAWSRTKLRRYAEDPGSGPFPAVFEEQIYTSGSVRLGLELVYRHTRATEFSGWIAYSERTQGDNASIRGRYLGLGTFDLGNLRVPHSDRAELGGGVSHALTAGVRVSATVGLLSSSFTSGKQNYYAMAGIGIGF